MDIQKTLINYFKAGFPGVAIQTTEEARACADIMAAAKSLGRGVVVWSASRGMTDLSKSNGGTRIPETEDLQAACKDRRANTIYIMEDPHTWPMDRDPVLLRAFKDFIAEAPIKGSSVVILAPSFRPHPTFEKMVVVMDYNLPSPEDLVNISKAIAKSAEDGDKAKKTKVAAASEPVIRALGGLTTTEAENALSLSLVEAGKFDADIIYREKVKAVKKSGLLDLVEPDPRGMDAVGGLDNLKGWMNRRKRVWSPEATKFGLPKPKGIMMIGCPGTGKSLSAKAIGTFLGVPTLKLDIGLLFNSLVGESEARTRDALNLAEALSPCVLWIDEIDKGLAGTTGSGSNDGGVTKRVFGSIISWMQEHKRAVFLVATANDVSSLPPELLRKGRFDELFALDLPNVDERVAILSIHLKARNRDPKNFNMDLVASACENFTGSEIEATLDEALFLAFDAGRELETQDLMTSANSITPLAITAKEQIEGIRNWAKSRARFATAPLAEKTERRINMQ